MVEPVETTGFFFAYNKGVPLCHTAKGRALAASPRYAVVFPQRSLTQSLRIESRKNLTQRDSVNHVKI